MAYQSAAYIVSEPSPLRIPDGSLFAESRIKLWRAEIHAYEVSKRWVNTVHHYSDAALSGKVQTNDGYTILNLPLDLLLPAAISDCIRNLRSSLDYLVSTLARGAGLPDNSTIFPFNEKGDDLQRSFDTKNAAKSGSRAHVMQELSRHYPELQTIILDQVQPFSAEYGARNGGDLLWRVITADNIDKHRLIIPAVQAMDLHNVRMKGGGQISGITIIGGGMRFHPGTEFEADSDISVEMVFQEPTRLALYPVTRTLVEAIKETRSVVEAFEAHFQWSNTP